MIEYFVDLLCMNDGINCKEWMVRGLLRIPSRLPELSSYSAQQSKVLGINDKYM